MIRSIWKPGTIMRRGAGAQAGRGAGRSWWHSWGMSNLDRAPEAVSLGTGALATGGLAPGVHGAVDVVEARKAAVGDGTEVRRLLPQRVLRTIGAWCFLDHYGPDDVSAGPGMGVPPHPHIGLQTATWLFDGLVLHRDSLGSEQLIKPGELNLMTSGRGIVHAEDSPADPGRPPVLHGVQLWIALPADHRFGEPGFAHHADLPVLRSGGARVTVVVGEFGGERSPAEVFSPLAGLEVVVEGGAEVALAVNPGFEHRLASRPASLSLAGHRSGSALSCGGTSLRARARRSRGLARTGKRGAWARCVPGGSGG